MNWQARWDSIGGNYTGILGWIGNYLAQGNSVRHACCGNQLAQEKAETGAAAAGVLVAGGAGLVLASGTTAGTLATASITSFTLFTGGVGLIVIGVGVAGYILWQYVNSNVADPGNADGVSTNSIYPNPN